ncbi:MAG: hypothetical protein ACOYNU_09455 [Bacteroidales bacterium]
MRNEYLLPAMTIVAIVKKNKFSILLVLSFVLLENISWIIESITSVRDLNSSLKEEKI